MANSFDKTYVHRICSALADELNEASASTALRRAEIAANIEFWISEIEHCLHVLDNYSERFERSASYRQNYPDSDGVRQVENMEIGKFFFEKYKRHRQLNRNDLNGLRSDLLIAAERLLQQCINDKLINKTTRVSALRRLKIKSK